MTKAPFTMPTQQQLLDAHAQFGTDPALLALGRIVEWWDALPASIRQDIEGSGAEPGCIAGARSMVDRR